MTQAHATVTRHWPTSVVIDDVDLTGIVDHRLVGDLRADGVPFERLAPSTVIADQVALIAEFLTSMNALAQGQGAAPVEAVELEMIRPIPGAHAAVPGWLTCSVVPVEARQYAVVAVARSVR